MDQELELKDVVRKLREDLQAAAEEGQGQAIKFKLETIELELKVAARKEGGPNGGIKFSVLGIGAEFGASAKWATEQVQTIKLKLVPVLLDENGQPKEALVNDRVDARRG
jgi:hypothetical protein